MVAVEMAIVREGARQRYRGEELVAEERKG